MRSRSVTECFECQIRHSVLASQRTVHKTRSSMATYLLFHVYPNTTGELKNLSIDNETSCITASVGGTAVGDVLIFNSAQGIKQN